MSRSDRNKGAMSAKPGPTAAAPLSASLYEAGLQHLGGGRMLDAQMSCEQALAADPNHADSLALMGIIALQTGQHDHAVAWFSRAIRQSPKIDYLTSLGFTLKQMGRLDDALAVFDKAIQLKPDDAELWKHMGGVLLAQNRSAEALLSYQHALSINPVHREAAFQSGLLLHGEQRYQEAVQAFTVCLTQQPDDLQSLQMRARCARQMKRYDDYLADCQRAQTLAPTDPLVCNNLGDALVCLGRSAEALAWFDKALALRPGLVDVLHNKGFALLQLLRFEEAAAIYREILAIEPDNAKAEWQLAHVELQCGDYEAGWAHREARWKMPDFSPDYPRFAQPKWLGKEEIAGQTILIEEDEGFGDNIQFARYLPMVAARGGKVILVVREPLQRLMAGIDGVSQCLAFTPDLQRPAFDMHCPIMSLPLAFGTTLATIPPADYLPPPPADRVAVWEQRLGWHDRLRVGLVWSGNPHQANDGNRSMPLSTLLPLLDVEADFISLQKELRPADKALLAQQSGIRDVTADLSDFAETAALMSCLDVVVTVCTSAAHLAATLGRPTWIMLPYAADWRWLRDRDDSPWYPSARLFRQDAGCRFEPVVARVRGELAAKAAAFTPTP
ncbi:putative TPR domain protein; putative O-GlcNAc transferase related protein [Bradyrhizobium sp. ORS 285]|uniref:tetratricopeptide repeat protein n=1 Tax=Bradyrhizobium sp. ORS 285 TaxID=115808 RepID=UPI0002408F20|nr:tetratricopeptide repeat protein [Bradyrhizobium sp. ORS 285]CCD85721.1 putative TPR domain protein; putative O-GlcNAc transferase related protein [Bradyrhizobium sp. ORS 285]SMX59034.1 putative TPR domain protein; putative O-GlcNAc transferase related protein [Bradyrhizobium sp. ORS 285]